MSSSLQVPHQAEVLLGAAVSFNDNYVSDSASQRPPNMSERDLATHAWSPASRGAMGRHSQVVFGEVRFSELRFSCQRPMGMFQEC